MAIKTELTDDELGAVAAEWGLGAVHAARGLPEGSVNTLYRLETARGRFVLRLSEGRSETEVRFETELLAYLRSARYPAVVIEQRPDGAYSGRVKGKFAAVFHWASGEHLVPADTSVEQAMESGRVLGRLHVVTEDFDGRLENRYGPLPVRQMLDDVIRRARERSGDHELQAAMSLLEREGARLDHLPGSNEGVIHADWFPDNLRFLGDRVAAVLDFEMACRGPYVLDLATAIHAGCFDEDFVPARVAALVAGYEQERRLSPDERAAFHDWARFSALRFTLSRVLDFHLSPLPPDRLQRKDWRRFLARLERTIALGPAGWLGLCGLA